MSFVLFLVSYDTVNVNETLTIDDNYVHFSMDYGFWSSLEFLVAWFIFQDSN